MDFTDAFGEGKYLRPIDLVQNPLTTAIISVDDELVINPKKGTEKIEPVAKFYIGRPLILNQINFMTIVNITKSRYTKDWYGKVITVVAIEDSTTVSGYIKRVINQPENIKLFLSQSVDLNDLRSRYKLIGQPIKYKDYSIKLSEKWTKKQSPKSTTLTKD